ncbi:MAG TPA: protein kinase [Thermoanaerobaculia bacterium]|jgi:tetratricopeptide (TPR) repeat protein
MPKIFEDLWDRVRALPGLFPEGLGDSPWVYLGGGAALFGVIFFLVWRFGIRRPDSAGRELRRAGDYLGMGQRYETLGQLVAARRAYARGGHHEEHAALLLRQGRREAAKQVARAGEVWPLYGDLCREDEDFDEAAAAYERAGNHYDAARAWEVGGRAFKAARAYLALGMDHNAVTLLMKGEGRSTAEALEAALRSSLAAAKGSAMSPDMARAVRRATQLWLQENEAERAYRLAADAELWETAVPIARDYLEPDSGRAEACVRAGAHLAAAEIYQRLGDGRQEALQRGEHHQRRDEAAEAARCFEAASDWSRAAEQWAAAGDLGRAAELYGRVEEFEQAAQLYAAVGDESGRRAMLDAARARDPRAALEAEEATRKMRPPTTRDRPGAPAPAFDEERYVLQEEIGRGGMGVVYRAYDAVLQRPVAYKVLSQELTGTVDRPADLMKEARAAARLSHPNIVQIYDAGETAHGFFVVMEYVEGENFARLLKKRRLSVQGALAVGRQVCAALEHAHRRRIVHRDLKPSNLIWTAENQVKLTDFGLARIFDGSMGKVLTRPAGTPFYMAPEQIRGDPVDARTDLYSLGCVLFEMLCNRGPFSGGSSIYHHLTSPPTDPRDARAEVPAELAVLILRCLEKDPGRRPPSAADVGRALAALAEPTSHGRSPDP